MCEPLSWDDDYLVKLALADISVIAKSKLKTWCVNDNS